jgi:hypothetical protein
VHVRGPCTYAGYHLVAVSRLMSLSQSEWGSIGPSVGTCICLIQWNPLFSSDGVLVAWLPLLTRKFCKGTGEGDIGGDVGGRSWDRTR